MNRQTQPVISVPLSRQSAKDEVWPDKPFVIAVWETDAAGRVVEDAPSWRAYTGQTTQQWFEQGWTAAIHPDERTNALRKWQQALQTKAPFNAELRLQSYDGSWRWADLQITVVLKPNGEVCKWVGVSWDITDKKQLEQTLTRVEERFQAFVTATSDAVYQMSADWRSMRQLVGKSFLVDALTPNVSWLQKYIPLADQASVQAVINEAIASKKPFELEHRVIRVDGSLGWTFSRAIPILNRQGEITEWFGTASDITERKQTQLHQAFLLQLSDALRPLTDPVAIQYQAAHVLGEFLAVNRIGYAIAQDDAQLVAVTLHYTQGVPGIEGVYRYVDYGPQLLADMQAGKTVVRPDIAHDPSLSEAEKAAHAQLQLGSTVNVPLIKQGRLAAILFIHNQQARPWSAYELVLIDETAQRIWAAVEQARIEASLREREAHAQAFNNLIPALIWRADALGKHIDLHAKWMVYTGQSFEETQNCGWLEAIHPEDRQETTRVFAEAFRTGQPIDRQQRIHNHHGEYRWFWIRHVPILDEIGQVCEWFGAAIDIHERKLAEEALRAADRRKDEFLAMLAHELRNPMATIRNGLNILAFVDGKDEASHDTLTMMSRQTEHLVHMVDDLLDVSRISQGKIVLRKERVNLVELVHQAAQAVESLYQQKQHHLQVTLPATPIFLEGDATRLTQVAINLLTNAARYTKPGGQIKLSLVHREAEAILQVQDNGIGIAADRLSAIFDLFVQVDNSLARSQGGLGLGLTLVKQLVEMHNGQVEAQSAGLNQGSIFTVHLPTVESMTESINESNESASSQDPTNRVLVIDDNPDAALTLSMLLKLKGYEVHVRNSGKAGVEAAAQLNPAAIILDIGMPDMDGYETCRLIRQQSRGKDIKIVALTGYGGSEDIRQSMEAGFDGHLIKPVDLDALINLLTNLRDGN